MSADYLHRKPIGAWYINNDRRCQFTVWAPHRKSVSLKIVSPKEQIHPMEKVTDFGYWQVVVDDVEPGTRYFYRLDDNMDRPDPASLFQPEGVHKASAVVDHRQFKWTDQDYKVIPLEEVIIYELHVGTFTPEGTFDAVIPRLAKLKELGVNAIEIMPVAQFPGERNWGYDGVYPYAVQNTYGGVDGLKRLVNACHELGLNVVMDVVYNHVGPEGNYFADFGPYFNPKYHPLWGTALNIDDAYCDGVREYLLDNSTFWFEQFHVDMLRLDAIQGIYDLSSNHLLEQLAARCERSSKKLNKKLLLIAESDLNDCKVIRPKDLGGFGIDAQWLDDYHHALHSLVTGERAMYYIDFGSVKHLEKSLNEGFIYSGQYSVDRKKCHGNSSLPDPAYKFVVHCQNHDQVGNRPAGDRLSKLTTYEGLKLSAGAVLLSPFLPLLFMGEEYGEEAPFFYFISHSDKPLIEAVQKSKTEEFERSGAKGDPYDPQAPETMKRCTLKWDESLSNEKHKVLWNFYQKLIQLRKSHPALKNLDKQTLKASTPDEKHLIYLHRWTKEKNGQVFYVMNFGDKEVTFNVNPPEGNWKKLLDSSDTCWKGPGATMPDTLKSNESVKIPAKSFVIYQA